jgi:hypothetical protein
MISSMFIALVLSLLCLGGSEAFNSIMGLVTGAVGLTYALSIGCLLWRKLFGAPLPPARWSLGRFGVAINMFSFLYEILTVVISFFPLFAKVNAQTMNWGELLPMTSVTRDGLLTLTFQALPCSVESLSSAPSITSSMVARSITVPWCS